MITVPGQLAIKTINGRNGSFNVGRLKTSIYSFTVKDAELDQYKEGIYEGEFVINHIFVRSYPINSGMAFEIRAVLDAMTLTNADSLTSDDASSMAKAEPDPADEEKVPPPVPATPAIPVPQPAPAPSTAAPPAAAPDAPAENAAKAASEDAPPTEDSADAALFGVLWPLGDHVKLDTTVPRQLLREQIRRLDKLGYTMDFKAQEFVRAA